MYIKNLKLAIYALTAILCAGMMGACENEKDHNWEVLIPSLIVANGDYLTSTHYGESDYDFKVEYYWDGSLILSADKNTDLNYLVSNQTIGEHKLKIVVSGEAKGTTECFVQVYEKERGFLGCNIFPSNRELKNGEILQGNVIYYPPTSEKGYMGTIKAVKFWIDDDKNNPVQTITSAPWHFSINTNNLSKGQHKLIMNVEGVYLEGTTGGGAGVVGGLLPYTPSVSYVFTITE